MCLLFHVNLTVDMLYFNPSVRDSSRRCNAIPTYLNLIIIDAECSEKLNHECDDSSETSK